QRERDRHLRSGQRQHEDEHHLSVGRGPARAGGDERERRRVQHDLDREQHEDQVAPHEHADQTEAEQDRGEKQRMLDRHGGAHSPSPSSARTPAAAASTRRVAAARASAGSASALETRSAVRSSRMRPIRYAPTRPARSSIDASSTARRYGPKSLAATAAAPTGSPGGAPRSPIESR